MDLLVAPRDTSGYQIDADIAELHHWRGRVCHLPPAAQCHPHPGQQLADTKWLDQIIIGPGIQRLDLIVLIHPGR